MSDNIFALREDCVLPEQVVSHLAKRTDIKHLYVVGVTAEGEFFAYGSGDLRYLGDASIVLSDIARKHLTITE